MAVRITGYGPSVYTWIARLALTWRGVPFDYTEADPFADPPPEMLLALHPFGRVPVLQHDGFILYETRAILHYIARAFPGPPLIPDDPQAAARMEQIIGITDAYAYWPLVRQVYSQAVFAPAHGREPDPAIIAQGLAAATRVLSALEPLADRDGPNLLGADPTLADLHLTPILDYFAQAAEGANALAACPNLHRFLAHWHAQPVFRQTRPLLLPG
ncbi:glutathione S-transferase family protein [Pseudoruegeria sp. HB172150]|uniref:glutathione S-transferase family protein n=1 Tax=Pseudoruegeria sp. HB172150 TaxID=2721164 RepID=UPI0015579487|nr:glutathione S-transferase family protein [Pseudoruegeria sp. HB172150]